MTLDHRAEQVLKSVVELYMANTEPVGARTLSKQPGFNLSPASLRNVMADLEEAGYLSQPHTSAGRVPSDKGYRRYVQSLIGPERLSENEKEDIRRAACGTEWGELVDLLMSVSKTLSDLSKQAGLVGLASWGGAPIKKIQFVHIEDHKILAVIVSAGGEIQNLLISSAEPVTQDSLDKMSNYFNDRFSGMSLKDIRLELLEEMKKEKDHIDMMLSMALSMAESIEERVSSVEKSNMIYLDGASNLISQTGNLVDISKIKALFKTFDEKSRLVSLLNDCFKSEGLNLIIGSESEMEELDVFSFVTHTFSGPGGSMGAVGIIGPKPMNYGRAMALVGYAAEQVSLRLAGLGER